MEEIERIEQEHINLCGYPASECGCCSSIIDKKKKENSLLVNEDVISNEFSHHEKGFASADNNLEEDENESP